MVASLRQTSQRQADQSSQLLKKLIKALWGLWGSAKPSDWWDDSFVWGRAAKSSIYVDTALQQARRQARSYASVNLTMLDAKPATLPSVEEIYPRYDTSALEAYVRPSTAYRWQWVETGGDEDAARDAAERRVEALAETDLAAAQRRVERDTYAAAPKAIGYRRIYHPELSEHGSCGLCIVAADQFYTLSTLLPLHPGCHCTTAPITRDSDPGQKLNRAELNALYNQAGSTWAEDLRLIRPLVAENGETGPTLRQEGQNVRTASDAGHKRYQEPTSEDMKRMWERQIEVAQVWIENLDKAAREDSSVTFEWRGKEFDVSPSDTALKYHRELLQHATAKLQAYA